MVRGDGAGAGDCAGPFLLSTVSATTAQPDLGDLVAVLGLRIAAEQQLGAGHQAVLVEPDLRTLGLEAHQLQSRIVLAALEPRGHEAVPQPINRRAIVVQYQLAVQRREQVVTLGCEVGDRAML